MCRMLECTEDLLLVVIVVMMVMTVMVIMGLRLRLGKCQLMAFQLPKIACLCRLYRHRHKLYQPVQHGSMHKY